METFVFEITRRIELATTIEVEARNEEEAENKVKDLIADGFTNQITISCPDCWETADDDTDYTGLN